MSRESMEKKVEDMTTTTFTIAGCPIRVFKDFIEYCEENAKMTKIYYNEGKKQIKEELCYSIGLKILLDVAKADAKTQLLFDRMTEIEDRMNVQTAAKKPKETFGSEETNERVVKKVERGGKDVETE